MEEKEEGESCVGLVRERQKVPLEGGGVECSIFVFNTTVLFKLRPEGVVPFFHLIFSTSVPPHFY